MNMQVEALSLPKACYNSSLECSMVKWKKKNHPLLRDLEWTSGTRGLILSSDSIFIKDVALRFQEKCLQLFSHITVQATEQVITESIENYLNELMNSSDGRSQTNSVVQEKLVNAKQANSNLFASCTDVALLGSNLPFESLI